MLRQRRERMAEEEVCFCGFTWWVNAHFDGVFRIFGGSLSQELMDVEEEKEEGSEEESSEWEEYSDSEEEETGPRLKPVFVRKSVLQISTLIMPQSNCHMQYWSVISKPEYI